MKVTVSNKIKSKKNVKPLIVGNWKMNPKTALEAKRLYSKIVKLQNETNKTEIWLAIPSLYISQLINLSKKISVGVQNIHSETEGAHTGEISASQVASIKASFTIIGHSERRAQGETDTEIAKKIIQAMNNKLSVILCIGEDERDDHGIYLSRVKSQIEVGLSQIKKMDLSKIIIAYEPVWAIGAKAKRPATPEECQEMVIYIKRVLSDLYGEEIMKKIKILYGGSANSKSVSEYKNIGMTDGFLLGRASLDIKELTSIVKELSDK